ncbi:MAG: recombinase family protein [Petrimonas sp.]|nr:recombinase family protein [Petrimonas sp.]
MIDGKIQIDSEKAKTVKRIFKEYESGASLMAIAKKLTEKKIPNANNKTNWTHGAVGRILENTKYVGDSLYPPLINKRQFVKVQELRKQKEHQLGRTAQLNSMKNQGIFANKIICGICGEPYRKYTEHCGKSSEKIKWKCKKYIFNNRVLCRNLFYEEDEIRAIAKNAINRLIKQLELLDKPYIKEPLKKSNKLTDVENRIKILEEQEQFSATELLQLIFKRAELVYIESQIHDYEAKTQKMKECLSDIGMQTEFNQEIFTQIVKRMIIYPDGKVETEFINGLTFEEILENKRKDGKNGSAEKECGNHTATDEI